MTRFWDLCWAGLFRMWTCVWIPDQWGVSLLSQIWHHAGLLGPGAYPQTHLPADLLPSSGAGPRGQEREGEWGRLQTAKAGQAAPQQSGLTCSPSPALRPTPTCPAGAAVAVSRGRRAPAISWPAVSRQMQPSPCCSPTTTSFAEEVTTVNHCLPPPPSFRSFMEGAPWGEQTLPSIVSLNSLAQVYNSGMCNPWEVREDCFQSLGHHCQSGTEAEAEPLPTVLNAMPTSRSPSSLLTFPTPLVSGFVTGNGLVL